jgi:hypothetical protein
MRLARCNVLVLTFGTKHGLRMGGVAGALRVCTATLPWMPSREALTVPLPALAPAVKVVLEPVDGETVPSEFGLTDQVALETTIGFPYASAPLAVRTWVPRFATVAEIGEMAMLVSGPGSTVSACVASVEPLELAVRVGVPASVSS